MVLAPAVVLLLALLAIPLSILAARLIVKVLQSLSGLPYIGDKIAGYAQRMGQAITTACGEALSGIDSFIGGTFHLGASYLNKTWRLISETPAVLARVAQEVGSHLYSLTGLKAAVHYLERVAHHVLHRLVAFERELVGIEHGIKTLERELGKGIGEDVLPRIRHLERKLSHLESETIPAVQGLAGSAEADAQTALRKVNAIPWDVNWKSWAEAISAGITAVGLSWLFCRLNPFNRNKNACGALGDLGELLGLVVALEAALDFDTLVHEAQDVAEVTSTAIMDVFGLSNG